LPACCVSPAVLPAFVLDAPSANASVRLPYRALPPLAGLPACCRLPFLNAFIHCLACLPNAASSCLHTAHMGAIAPLACTASLALPASAGFPHHAVCALPLRLSAPWMYLAVTAVWIFSAFVFCLLDYLPFCVCVAACAVPFCLPPPVRLPSAFLPFSAFCRFLVAFCRTCRTCCCLNLATCLRSAWITVTACRRLHLLPAVYCLLPDCRLPGCLSAVGLPRLPANTLPFLDCRASPPPAFCCGC